MPTSDQPDEPDGADWGRGEASTPRAIKVEIKPESFIGEGDPRSVREIYRLAGLYRLIENLGLILAALLMLVIAAWVAVRAPPAAAGLVPWIAVPPCVLAFGVSGFAAFRISATKRGFEVSGGPAPAIRRTTAPKP